MERIFVAILSLLALLAAVLGSYPAVARDENTTAAVHQAPLSRAEIDKLSAYGAHWNLGGANADMPHEEAVRLAAMVAQEEFAGRGPALARYFLTHQEANNNALIFLLSAVGDAQTAHILIHALPDPPEAVDSVLDRHATEIEAAIGSMLEDEELRRHPSVLRSLEGALAKARAIPWGGNAAGLLISLIGRLQTPQAVEVLEELVGDPDPAIRQATAKALGQTGLLAAKPALERALGGDGNADVRRDAAASLGRMPSGAAVSALERSLEQEQNPRAVDAILQSISMQGALPTSAQSCLEMAEKGWNPGVILPFFECWRKAATLQDLISQAVSGSWPVRALAMDALTKAHPPKPRRTLVIAKNAVAPPPVFEEIVQQKLLRSAIEIYSNEISGVAKPGSISHETARIMRSAFWEIAGRNMDLALSYADRIEPVSGRYTHIGRYGMSSHLSDEDPEAYAAMRRPGQLAGISVLLAGGLLLSALRRTRKMGVGVVAGTGAWMVWLLFQTGVDEFPPPPMWLVSVSGIGFLSAGLAAGAMAMLHIARWLKIVLAPLLAGLSALVACGLVFDYELYPIGPGGWELFFAPIASALLAFPVALFIAVSLIAVSKADDDGPSKDRRSNAFHERA